MKVYLDDVRKAPEGWVLLKTPQEVKEYLKTNKVSVLSLDHDLGDDDRIGTGYDILTWIEEMLYLDIVEDKIPYGIPLLLVHSANPVARDKMVPLANKINKDNIK